MKHFIITRVAINFKKLPEENFIEKIPLLIQKYNLFLRKSLSKQTNQNFIVIICIDKDIHLDLFKPLFNNERLLITQNHGFKQGAKDFINTNFPLENEFIITRIDSDDLLRKDFVQNLQDLVFTIKPKHNMCFDIFLKKFLCLNTKNIYTQSPFSKKISAFTSSYEKIDENNPLKLMPYTIPHIDLGKHYKVFFTDKLNAIHTVDGLNIKNHLILKRIKDNKKVFISSDDDIKDYGINL
jgi:hypothetical protein